MIRPSFTINDSRLVILSIFCQIDGLSEVEFRKNHFSKFFIFPLFSFFFYSLACSFFFFFLFTCLQCYACFVTFIEPFFGNMKDTIKTTVAGTFLCIAATSVENQLEKVNFSKFGPFLKSYPFSLILRCKI